MVKKSTYIIILLLLVMHTGGIANAGISTCTNALLADNNTKILSQNLNHKDIGFAIIKAPNLLNEGWLKILKKSMISSAAKMYFQSEDQMLSNKKKLSGDLIARELMFPYINWAQTMLSEALPTESIFPYLVEVRKYSGGKDRPSRYSHSERLHADGGYIAVTISFEGPGTIVKDYNGEKEEVNSLPGEAVFMTAVDRTKTKEIRPTLHKAPSDFKDRFIIIIRFRASS